MEGRVRIGTCSGPAEAALVRAMFGAHDIRVLIGGEHHASMLGGLGGAFLRLDIWVASEDAEDATALLAELREGRPVGEGEDVPADAEAEDDDDEAGPPVASRVERRRRSVIALVLACGLTFGAGHFYTRAWLRGLGLAGFELFALRQLGHAPGFGAGLIVLGVALDAVGALLRVRAATSEAERGRVLPRARVVPPRS